MTKWRISLKLVKVVFSRTGALGVTGQNIANANTEGTIEEMHS